MTDERTTASFRNRHVVMLIRWVLFLMLAGSQSVRADSQHDVLAFLSAEAQQKFSASDPSNDGFEDMVKADFLYTYNSDRFRFLAEYVWSDTESELERIQAAWQIDDGTMLWIGRYHAISNYWTTEFHHGQFMQTSISRPGLEEWEDESGPMPSHITGAWLEHEYAFTDQSVLDIGLSAGLAPKFAAHQLLPFDVLDPDSGHDLAISGRLVFRPDVLSTNQIGLALAQNDIAVESESSPLLTNLNSIRQSTLGIFADWRWTDWRLSTNWVYFDIDLQNFNSSVKEDFVLAYVQGEYEAADDWTVFSRVEFGFDEDDSLYLQLLPAVVAHRQMFGLRWDFADSQSLTMEVAATSVQGENLSHDNYKEIRLQWSAVFP